MTEKFCDNCKHYIIFTCYCQLKKEVKFGACCCENYVKEDMSDFK